MIGTKVRLAAAGLLGAMALGTVGSPVVQAGTTTCRVRNITQDTVRRSFAAMVAVAHDGDRLTVRGACPARSVTIGVDIGFRGVGERRAVLDARGERHVLWLRWGTDVTLRHLVITGGGNGKEGGGIHSRGTLTLIGSVIRDNRAAEGGGIWNQAGTMTLIGSVLRDNTAGT